ncbi:thiol S-methyltransferase TMT1A-like isoform X2 [Ambystoma mexicanum]
MQRITVNYNQKMGEKKKDLFNNMSDFAKPSGELSVLEVGCGTGANFQFYPRGCKVICVDPNPNFQQYISKSIAENEHVHFERFLVAPGEDMPQVASGSVDVVVCTIVLCSVQSVEAFLKECIRVLRPGGAFYFLEHVRDAEHSWLYFVQRILQPSWIHIGDGCQLTRETWKYLENAAFSEVKMRHIQAPLKWSPVRPHIIGFAVK